MNFFKFRFKFLIFLFLVIDCCVANNVTSKDLSDEEAVEKLSRNFGNIKKYVKEGIKMLMPIVMERMYNDDFRISIQCQRSLLKAVAALREMKSWAVYMVDANAKSLDGLFLGTMSSFGNFDECVGITATERKHKNGKENVLFQGKYCTIQGGPIMPKKPKFYKVNQRMEPFKVLENETGLLGEVSSFVQLFYFLNFRFGICIPSTCEAEDIYKIANGVLKDIDGGWVSMPRCEVREENKIEDYQIPVICAFAALLTWTAFATIVDLFYKYRHSKGKKTKYESYTVVRGLRCFSAVSNLQKVLDVNAGADKLKALHGIRFYSICWIVLGHTYFYVDFQMLKNLRLTLDFLQNVSFNIISNATLLVDNFFFISGLLMTYISYEVVKKTKRTPKFWQFIVHRLYRFLPMQMTFVGVTMLLPWLGSGPLWHENIDPLVESCRSYWWTNMIFINNLYRSGLHSCVSHSWYLATDLQIYIVCLIVLIPMFRYPKLGLIINGIFLVSSTVVCGVYNYVKRLPPTLLYSNPDPEQRMELMMDVYYTPYSHLPAYCVGMYVGHFLHSSWARKRMPVWVQIAGWLGAVLMTSAPLFGVQVWNTGSDPGPEATATYAGLSRLAWTLGLAWITWACSTGHGGLLNRLLCWKPLIPLSRLTFSVYLVHPFVQRVFYATIRQGVEARNTLAVVTWFGFLCVSFLLGMLVCVFIESPFISLGAVIFERHNAWEEKARSKKKLRRKDLEGQSPEEANGVLPTTEEETSSKDPQSKSEVPNGIVGQSNNGYVCHL